MEIDTSNAMTVSDNSDMENEDRHKGTDEEFLDPNSLKVLPSKSKAIESKPAPAPSVHREDKEKQLEKSSFISPAQEIAEKITPIPYKEPVWSGLPKHEYSLDVLKGGLIIQKIPIYKSFLVVGRFSQCDIYMQNPTISRFHCVIQYRSVATEEDPAGMYVYDLDSTHGTYQNKYRLQPLVYNRLRVGHMLKFGKSTRMFILQGPDEDQEAESKYTVTELKAIAEERKRKIEKIDMMDEDSEEKFESNKKEGKSPSTSNTNEGIDWGMGEDAVEEETEENPFSTNDELYLEDPKKTLRGWFEREGFDLPAYEVTDISPGQFKCTLQLPLQDSGSSSVMCSINHKGKKKEAVIQCALEACRILDRRGLLRQATHESRKRQKKNWSEDDYYASDEDEFLDRTGDIDHKRRMRKRKSESSTKVQHAETYQSLSEQYEKVSQEIERIETLILNADKVLHRGGSKPDEDIDEFMKNLSSSITDRQKVLDYKVELNKLKKEEERLRYLVNIARPPGVKEITAKNDRLSEKKNQDTRSKKSLSIDETATSRHGQILSSNNMTSTLGTGVHHLFLEEDEPRKMKLTKVDFNDESPTIKPVPYEKGERKPNRYSDMLKKEREKSTASKSCIDKAKDSDILEISTKGEEIQQQPQPPKSTTLSQQSSEDEEIPGHSLLMTKGTDDVEAAFAKPSIEFKPKTKKKKVEKESIFSFEKDYETWVPPSGQTGDGRTSLNEKYGY